MPGNRKQTYLQRKNYNMQVIEGLFNIVAPHECLSCQKEGSLLCYDCGSGLVAPPPRCYMCRRWDDESRTCQTCRRHTSIHSLWTAANYEGTAKELLRHLKFERASAGAATIAELLAKKCAAKGDFIISYIPTANKRVRERGYDQAYLIARQLAGRLGRPCIPCLARTGSQRQLGTSRQIRKQQMEGVFRPIKPEALKNKYILLVDDVLTTGATCEAAARVLRQAGAKRVSAAVFAVA